MNKIDELQIEYISESTKYLCEKIQRIANELSETLEDITFSNFDYISISFRAKKKEDLIELCFDKNNYNSLSDLELKFSEKFLAKIKDENIENLVHKYIYTFKDEISGNDFIEIYPNEVSIKIEKITGNKKQILDINTHRNVLEEKGFYYER